MSEGESAVVGPERHPHRPAPVDTEPSGRLDEVLGLLDELTEDSGEGSSVPGFLQLTDQGAALVEQIEGVQVRILDTLVGGQGEQGVRGFRATLQAIAEVWNSVASHVGHLELRAGPR